MGFDVARLKQEVRATYASVASDPSGNFHFHRGPEYAARLLSYDLAELDLLPQVATAPFAGVGIDSFSGTSKERVARKYEVRGANFMAFK